VNDRTSTFKANLEETLASTGKHAIALLKLTTEDIVGVDVDYIVRETLNVARGFSLGK